MKKPRARKFIRTSCVLILAALSPAAVSVLGGRGR